MQPDAYREARRCLPRAAAGGLHARSRRPSRTAVCSSMARSGRTPSRRRSGPKSSGGSCGVLPDGARARHGQEAEALPEADRLEGFPHPRETPALIGHDAAERELAAGLRRRPHASRLADRGPRGHRQGDAGLPPGPSRAGPARGARRRRDRASRSARRPTAARQVRALSHPGLLVLRRPYDPRAKRFAASILIDEVRRLRSFLGLTAGEGAWRVVIVDAADELNINAANALLKSLEEPPTPRAVPADLVRAEQAAADHPLALPPARPAAAGGRGPASRLPRRRSRRQSMEPPRRRQWPLLERLAEGSVRRALQLAGSGGLELYARIEAIFAALAQGRLAGRARALRPARARRPGAALRGLLRPAARPAGAAGARARHRRRATRRSWRWRSG